MTHIMACIDGSHSSSAVCDCAAWAGSRLEAPLILLHVLDHQQYPVETNLSGSIGLGSREHLLNELAALDAQRSKLALEQGRLMLDAAQSHILATKSTSHVSTLQRHGNLLDTLCELEEKTRLVILGRQGQDHSTLGQRIGSHLEGVTRVLHKPLWITPEYFQVPQKVLVAFDGSSSARHSVERLAATPLLKGLSIHVVMVGEPSRQAELTWAGNTLQQAGLEAQTLLLQGEVEPTLLAYQVEQNMDLVIMGAYGHSRVRRFLLGSTTSHLIQHVKSALLLLR